MTITTRRSSSVLTKMGRLQLHQPALRSFPYFRSRGRIQRFTQAKAATLSPAMPAATPTIPLQIGLFGGLEVDATKLKIKPRFVRKKRPKNAKKMVQYKIPYWKGVKGERKRDMKGRLHEQAGNDSDVFEMTDDGYTQFMVRILEYLPKELTALGSRDSNRIAEIVAWIDRRFTDDPFSFEQCCNAAGVHPDNQRDNVLDVINELYGESFNHYRILRNNVIDAEAGDQRGVDWVLSKSDVAKSFNDCCRALGFNPDKARSEILIPVHMLPEPLEAHVESVQIDQAPTPAVKDEDQIELNLV